MMNLYADWNYPSHIRIGAGRITELAQACRELRMTSPLLITDPGLATLPMVGEAIASCIDAGLTCGLFSNIHANPDGDNIMDGVLAYKAGGHDGVIAFGGGSALDAGKAVALMVGQDRSIWDFEDVGDNWTRVAVDGIAPIVAVPTTAGTGSEVGRASVITDSEHQVKKIIFHPKMQPGRVILDPELTIGLPAGITAATGMDALSHNLEALCAPFYHPMADGIAMEAIRLIKNYLPRAYADGHDLDARTQMLVASMMGATAFQKGLGGMHAIAHTLGALYGAHHGLLNAIVMPYILMANREKIEQKIIRLGHYLRLDDATFDGFIRWILKLRRDLGIAHSLRKIDIDDVQAERVGAMAATDPAASGNPVSFDAHRYAEIFTNAVKGDL